MINEEVVGGLISALSRGEPLEKAMMTFYNAGYKKEEIEASAKEVYRQLGAQAMGINGSLQDTLNEIASKAEIIKKPEEKKENTEPEEDISIDKLALQKASPSKDSSPSINNPIKDNRVPQNVSGYGQINYNSQYQNADDITNKIIGAIKGLNQVSIPSRIEIVQKNIDSKPSTVIQKVSDYSSAPKSISKAMTYVLIGVLILSLLLLLITLKYTVPPV